MQVKLFCRRAGGGLLVRVNVAAFSLPFRKDSGVQLVSSSPEGVTDLLTA